MKTFASILALALFALTAACGDDDGRTPVDSGTGGTDGGTGGTDGGTGGTDSGTGGTDAGGTGSGACTNASDTAAIEREDYGPSMDKSVSDIAAEEGRSCALSGEEGEALRMCTADAIVEETEGAVSDGCASCYGLSVQCSAENCLVPCLAGSDSADCVSCRCGDNDASENCIDLFTECSGVPSDMCDGI